jgi:hypothetical protein
MAHVASVHRGRRREGMPEKTWIVNDVVDSRYIAGRADESKEGGALMRGSIADEEQKVISTPLVGWPQFGST